MLHQSLQDGADLATGFARADHVDVKVSELLGVAAQSFTQWHAAFDIVEYGLRELEHGGLVVHADQYAQGVVKRQAGFEHDGQLAAHDQNVSGTDVIGFEAIEYALGCFVLPKPTDWLRSQAP